MHISRLFMVQFVYFCLLSLRSIIFIIWKIWSESLAITGKSIFYILSPVFIRQTKALSFLVNVQQILYFIFLFLFFYIWWLLCCFDICCSWEDIKESVFGALSRSQRISKTSWHQYFCCKAGTKRYWYGCIRLLNQSVKITDQNVWGCILGF